MRVQLVGAFCGTKVLKLVSGFLIGVVIVSAARSIETRQKIKRMQNLIPLI